MNSYFDEKLVIEQMLEAQRTADRAQALGLMQGGRPVRRRRLRARLGQALVVLGRRLQQPEVIRRPALPSGSEYRLR